MSRKIGGSHGPAIDAFLAGLDEERLPQLVSYGSDALVARLAERTLAGAGLSDWRRR